MFLRRLMNALINRYYIYICSIYYPNCKWLISWNPKSVAGYPLLQRVLNINNARHVAWPVHFTSRVFGEINVGDMTAPGMMPGIYVNGSAGITFGDGVFIGPGVKIISMNHDPDDLEKHLQAQPMHIGSNVWIGANAIILPGVTIGNHVVIGAGSVVTKSIPDNKVAVGNPARIIKEH
jgi:acetyltransferase-like isoleucine patch superfamily enzyme